MTNDLAAIEREKYERVWGFDVYRDYSPAEKFVKRNPSFVRGLFTGTTVAEYGSGTGRGSLLLHDMGYVVTMVDHCDNALDEAVRGRLSEQLTFSHQNLWLMEGIETDHFICIDVMEHIPPEKVEAVLAAIASQTRDNGVFEICVVPDNLGRVTIGQPLHLSVLSPDVWIALVEAHFVVEKYSQPSPTSLTIVVKKRLH